LKYIKPSQFYGIQKITDEGWIKDYKNEPMSYWQILRLFRKGWIKNINPVRYKNSRWITNGYELRKFLAKYYGRKFDETED
jgi:hypothetical protein